MQIHQLKPKHKRKKIKRVSRGGKRGTYSGRGQKGQKSRAGRKMQPIIRELIKKYPKRRGYRWKPRGSNLVIVNIETLDKIFEKGAEITPQILISKKIISKIKGKMPEVKILGKGKLNKALTIKGCAVSKQAKEMIEKAGGQVINARLKRD